MYPPTLTRDIMRVHNKLLGIQDNFTNNHVCETKVIVMPRNLKTGTGVANMCSWTLSLHKTVNTHQQQTQYRNYSKQVQVYVLKTKTNNTLRAASQPTWEEVFLNQFALVFKHHF